MVTKYQKHISGPMLDRIDIHVEVRRVDYEKLSGDRLGEKSEFVRARVQTARAQPDVWGGVVTGYLLNGRNMSRNRNIMGVLALERKLSARSLVGH